MCSDCRRCGYFLSRDRNHGSTLQVDYAPTWLAMAGIATPATYDGRSILTQLIPQDAEAEIPEPTRLQLQSDRAGLVAKPWRTEQFHQYCEKHSCCHYPSLLPIRRRGLIIWSKFMVTVWPDTRHAHTRARAFTCIYTAADCDLTFADNQGGPSPYYPQGCEQVPNEFMPCEGWAPGSSTNPTQKAGDLSEPRFPRDMGLMATVRPLDDYSNTYVTSSSNASKWMLGQVALPPLMICS